MSADKTKEKADGIIGKAYKQRASGIHLEAFGDECALRFRVDGVMQTIEKLDRENYETICNKFKEMANLSPTKQHPQDGRIRLQIEKKNLDLRISTFPCVFGENICIKILAREAVKMDLDKFFFDDLQMKQLKDWLSKPNGLIVVSGAVCSGKTTTLYAMLNNLNRDSVNIMTIEDPVEYTFKGINQAGLNPKAGITFPAALRSIMRHDPDIVMVGEIRDYETSLLLIQGALTGHLILTNLHTNTATDAVIRLRDIGVEPFLIRDALTGVVAQCLVRKLCEHCRKEYKPEKEMIEHLNLQQGKKFFKAVGCERCHNGYRGRIAIHELFQFGDTTKKLILKGCSPEELRNQAVKEGMVTIRQDGINKVAQGLTTLKEIIRVTSA